MLWTTAPSINPKIDFMKPADAKLQRWIDLLAALLSHRFGATFAELKTLVPAYGEGENPATLARMFERDKDELRALGLPIRVKVEDTEDGQTQRYQIKASEMYLPYLALASRAAGSAPARHIPPPGYRDVPTLAFEPDELSALVRAAREAKTVGDPALARDAESALRKLTYDLGVALGSVADEAGERAMRIPEASAAPTVSVLGDALLRRKHVTFVYHSMRRDVTEERTVEPYGLAFSSGHWYLVGRDAGAEALRKFRVSRIENVETNAKKPQTADYEIPKHFDLAEHARARESWELGDDAPEEMVVEVRGESGVAMSVRSLGAEVPGDPARRRFQVRRVDSFARWLMSFGGEVVPVAPPSLRESYHAIVASTLATYDVADGRSA
jgi:proteasome accessory factor B